METPARFTFSPDGSTKVFPIPVTMKGDNYVRIDVNATTINDRNKFDIVNNAIVFVDVTDVPAGSQLDVLVVQTDEGIANLGNVNSIDIVSQNINNVNTAATNVGPINTVATNIAAINNVNTNMTDVQNAVTSASNAAASATAASNSATAASASETAAASSASSAASSATTAGNHASAAALSLSNTQAAELAAIQASADADTAKNAAATSATNAAASATAAGTSETNAASSASAASTSATNAAGSATAASTSETNAASSASAAAASATAASNSAAGASASATSAANSAAAASAALDNFDDRYLGPKASDPTLDNDNNPLLVGALYYNSTSGQMRVYDGANWIVATSAGNTSLLKYEFVATGGQTVFSGADSNAATLSYAAENIIVALNGVILDEGADYTATNGTSVTLTSGAAVDDVLTIIAFKSFTVADMVPASTGGTFQGNVAFNGSVTINNWTITEVGGTLFFATGGGNKMKLDASGNLVVTGEITAFGSV